MAVVLCCFVTKITNLLSTLCMQVAGALAATTEYDEPDPPMPPPNATPEDMAALEAKASAATSLSVAGFRVQGIKGTVKGYSSITLPVEFTPRVAGKLARLMQPQGILMFDVPFSCKVAACAHLHMRADSCWV
jgi:hypothetical protein